MAYSQQQIQEQLALWNEAARKLPPPKDGAQQMVDGYRFCAHGVTNGVTGEQSLEWELMSSNWRPTGIVWPDGCFKENGRDEPRRSEA